MVFHELLEVLFAGRLHHPPIHPGDAFAFSFNGNYHQALLAFIATGGLLILATHIGFIHVYLSCHRKIAATFHRLHYLLFEQPARFLAQFQFAAQFRTAHPILAGGNVVDDVESLQKREFAAVEQRACQRGLDVAATRTLPVIGTYPITVLAVATFATGIPFFPLQLGQIFPTLSIVWETGLKLKSR